MNRLAAIATVVIVLGMLCCVPSALGAFGMKEAKEGGVTLSNSESATAFIFGKEKEKLEVVCKTIKAEGSVMENSGKTWTEAGEDEPASTPAVEARQVGLKVSFESCEAPAKKAKATVNAEKCQFELYQTEKSEPVALSLRAAKAKTACVLKVELVEPKCTIEAKAAGVAENENLESLKLKNKAGFEAEIGAGSEAKGMKTKASGACGTPAEPEGVFAVKKALVAKGVELTEPIYTENFGTKDLVDFGNIKVNTTLEKTITLTIGRNNTKYEGLTVTNIGPAGSTAFKKKAGSDTCTGNTFNATESCQMVAEFTPTTIGQFYAATFVVTYKEGGNNFRDLFVFLGEGKA